MFQAGSCGEKKVPVRATIRIGLASQTRFWDKSFRTRCGSRCKTSSPVAVGAIIGLGRAFMKLATFSALAVSIAMTAAACGSGDSNPPNFTGYEDGGDASPSSSSGSSGSSSGGVSSGSSSGSSSSSSGSRNAVLQC